MLKVSCTGGPECRTVQISNRKSLVCIGGIGSSMRWKAHLCAGIFASTAEAEQEMWVGVDVFSCSV